MFLQACVILFTPQEQTPPGSRPHPGADTPKEQTPVSWFKKANVQV